MANTKSAAKRARQTVRRTAENTRVQSNLKTQLKKTRALLASKDQAAAKAQFQVLSSTLDKAVKSGQLHKNAANRHKSTVAKALAKAS